MTLSSLFRSDTPEGDDGNSVRVTVRRRRTVAPDSAAAESLQRSVAALKKRQHEDGWWKGELETNVTMDAEDLLLREFLGIRTDRQTAAAARWIRSRQRDDGTWATYYGGPPDLSTTIEAYVALKLAGDTPDEAHMQRALEYIRGEGGIGASRVFTRIWLALFGKWPWESLPILPPELMLLPPWVPLNIYDFGCWARQTVVALTVVNAHRPVRELSIDIDELDLGPAPAVRRSLGTWAGRFDLLDRALHLYELRPIGFLRRFSLGKAERWIIKRQEADGSWGGIQPPWVYSLIALHLQGYPLDHPVMQAALEGLDAFTIEDEAGRRIEACQSPVWDTALAVVALADAGVPPDDPSLRRAGRWLVDEEITVPGDWTVRRPDLAPGGWAFEFANDNYPDIDDTAEVVLALRRTRAHGQRRRGPTPSRGPRECSVGTAGGPRSTSTTRAPCVVSSRSATSASSSIHRARTSPRTSSRCSPSWDRAAVRPSGGSCGCSMRRRPTVRGSAAGGRTISTAPAPLCRRWSRPACRPAMPPSAVRWTGSKRIRTAMADGARIFGRTATLSFVVVACRMPARPPGPSWPWLRRASEARHVRGVSPTSSTTNFPTGHGTRPGSPEPDSPGTSTINYHLYHLVFPVMALGRYVHGWDHG